MSELLIEQKSTFGGDYPEVATRKDFQLDPDDNDPVFMTLPLGQAGNESANGRVYDRVFYTELVRQVNEAPPVVGIVGHSDPLAASWKVDLPALEWVGAAITETGQVWGKAYIYPDETKLRATVKRAKRKNLEIATSIWGNAQMEGKRAINPTIKRIDFADPERAGVKAAVAVPILTSEMTTGDKTVSDTTNELVSELRSDRDKARETLVTVQTDLRELQSKFSQIDPQWQRLQEMAQGKDIVVFVSELVNERNQFRAEKLQLEINQLISEQVKLEDARPLILTMLGNVESKEKAQTRLSELLNDETVKKTLQALALASSGGRVFVGEHLGNDKLDTSPEAMRRAQEDFGYGF